MNERRWSPATSREPGPETGFEHEPMFSLRRRYLKLNLQRWKTFKRFNCRSPSVARVRLSLVSRFSTSISELILCHLEASPGINRNVECNAVSDALYCQRINNWIYIAFLHYSRYVVIIHTVFPIIHFVFLIIHFNYLLLK